MTNETEQATATAAPAEDEQSFTADEETLELLSAAREELDLTVQSPEPIEEDPGHPGAEADASDGDIEEPQPQPINDDEVRKGGPLPPEVQASIDRRIGKEVSKRKELEDLLENEKSAQRELEEKLRAAEASVSDPSIVLDSSDPYLGMTAAELDKKEVEGQEFKQWALRNWDGYNGSGEENDPDWSAENVRERYAQIEEETSTKIPRQRELLKQRQNVEAKAVDQFPFLVDKNAPGFEEAARLYHTKSFQSLLKVDPSCLFLLGHAARDIYLQRINGSHDVKAPEAPPIVPTEARPTGGPGPAAPTRKKTTGLTKTRAAAAAAGDLETVVGEMMGL